MDLNTGQIKAANKALFGGVAGTRDSDVWHEREYRTPMDFYI